MCESKPLVKYEATPLPGKKVTTRWLRVKLESGADVSVGLQAGHPHGGGMALAHEFCNTQPDTGERTLLRFSLSEEAASVLIALYTAHGIQPAELSDADSIKASIERGSDEGGTTVMNTETVTIILPLPSPLLSPNRPPGSMGGRMRKAVIAKRYRRLARLATLEERIEPPPWMKATVQARFFHKTRRRRDGVNFNAMLKPAQDGIVDAGLVIDDDSEHLTTLPPEFAIDYRNPRVEMTIERQA